MTSKNKDSIKYYLEFAVLVVSIVTPIALLLWLFVELKFDPLKADVVEIKEQTKQIKSPEELDNMMDLRVVSHELTYTHKKRTD